MLSTNSKSLEDKNYEGREGNICEDKISSLPEDLIIHILMFLPTRDVVATMFLSKRWKSIWKMVPRLEYKEREGNTNNKDETVWYFLDKSFQRHKAPILESLSIKLDNRCPVDADVSKWIARAIDLQVRMLNLILGWSGNPIVLPTSLYTCETLVELNLKDKILIDVPCSAHLTSLRKLDLDGVAYKDEVSVTRLLSKCIVLEQLSVKRYRNDNVKTFIVEVPSLKNLIYVNRGSESGGALIVECQALKKLLIADFNVSFSLKNMPHLDKVFVTASKYPDENYLTSVRSLNLVMNHGMVNCCNAVYLPRLKALSIRHFKSDWIEGLLLLLKNSPILTRLIIYSVCNRVCPQKEYPLSWYYPNSVPKCVSSNLEVFKWHAYGGRIEEKELVKYILGNSKYLKYAEFHLSWTDLETSKTMQEELNSMFRVSTSNLKVYPQD